MKLHRQDSIVIQRRTIARTVLSDDGSSCETVRHEVTVNYDGFDSLVDWEKVYDTVVDATKKEAFKNL